MRGRVYCRQVKDFTNLSPRQLFITDCIIASTCDDGVVESVEINVLAADPWLQI